MEYRAAYRIELIDCQSMPDGCRQVVCAAQMEKNAVLNIRNHSASKKDINSALCEGRIVCTVPPGMPVALALGRVDIEASPQEGLSVSPNIWRHAWKH